METEGATVELWFDTNDNKWHWALNFMSLSYAVKAALNSTGIPFNGRARWRWTAESAARRAARKLGVTLDEAEAERIALDAQVAGTEEERLALDAQVYEGDEEL